MQRNLTHLSSTSSLSTIVWSHSHSPDCYCTIVDKYARHLWHNNHIHHFSRVQMSTIIISSFGNFSFTFLLFHGFKPHFSTINNLNIINRPPLLWTRYRLNATYNKIVCCVYIQNIDTCISTLAL